MGVYGVFQDRYDNARTTMMWDERMDKQSDFEKHM